MIGYNIKIEKYHNGAVQVSIYPNGVECMMEGESALRKDYFSKNDIGHYYRESPYVDMYNPFTDRCEIMVDLNKLEDIEKKEERCLHESLKRTRRALYRYSRCGDWQYFITLTYSSEKVNRYDFSECMTKARKWINNQKDRKSKDLQYLLVPEMHKDGAWHVHGLLGRCGDIDFVDSGHKAKGQKVYNLSGWRYGFSTATKVRDINRCSTYICKYITKEICKVTKHKHRYYVSNNLYDIETSYILCESDLFGMSDVIANALGAEFQYEKEINGFNSAVYRYYKIKEKESEQDG